MSSNRTLIISPHLDDEVLGCSSFLQTGGRDITILYGTTRRNFADFELVLEENRNLIEFLDCKSRFLEFTVVNHLDRLPIAELIKDFEEILDEEKPDTVLLANPSYNQDHRAIYEAMLTALRPHDRIHFAKRVLLYEQPETFGTLRKVAPFQPTYYRPLDMDFKIRAMGFYRSQIRGHRSFEHLTAIARLRGMQANIEYAEAFEIARWVK